MSPTSPAFALRVIDGLLITIGPYIYVPPDEPVVYDVLDGGKAGTDFGFAVDVDGGDGNDNSSIPFDGGNA